MAWTAPIACAASVFVIGLAAIVAESDLRLPGNHRGFEPVQPIAYSHRLHAGDLQMDCLACHYGAETGRRAGIPPVEVCMGCHRTVTAGFDAILEERERAEAEGREPAPVISPELRKLYDAAGLDENLEPDPAREPRGIEWVRVHALPDHVAFDHRFHVARDIACAQCHGPVTSMERVRQESTLSMGWCIDCHRRMPADPEIGVEGAAGVSTDCARCHY